MRLRVSWQVLSLEAGGRGRVLNASFRASQGPARPQPGRKCWSRLVNQLEDVEERLVQGVWAADRLINSSDLPEGMSLGQPLGTAF